MSVIAVSVPVLVAGRVVVGSFYITLNGLVSHVYFLGSQMIIRKHYKSESNRNILAHFNCLVHSNPSIMLAVMLCINSEETCHKNKN